MNQLLGPLVVFAVVVGHFGLHLAIYNRLNATGLRRRRIKRIEKFFLMTMMVLPPLVIWMYPQPLGNVIAGQFELSSFPRPLLVYFAVCLATWIVLGIPWLLWRPIFRLEWASAPRDVTLYRVEDELDQSLARSSKCLLEAMFPYNQIFQLSVERITLPIPHLPLALEGYRIAHLSDIHLTGDVEPEYMAFVIAQAKEWEPDLFALTGDVIDKQPCIEWLYDLFRPAKGRDGCYYILGNHDTRVVDPGQTRRELCRAGWVDLGTTCKRVATRGITLELIGNEYPWFPRPTLDRECGDAFRILLSHSPDQLGWARKHQIPLMLAGHTHGGQGRLPLAGPLLSPSWHGSRYASGDFYKAPTTMHVSRGLGGVHLLRLRCAPELSLIELARAK